MVMEFSSLKQMHEALQGEGRNRIYASLIREHNGQFKFRNPGVLEGNATFQLEYATSPSSTYYALPTVKRVADPSESWFGKLVHATYSLWGERGLSNVRKEFTAPEGAAQSIQARLEREVKTTVEEFWPHKPLEQALEQLHLQPCAAPDVFREWFKDGRDGSAFDFRNLDFAHSRVTDKRVSLTFLTQGAPLRLEFKWKPHATPEYKAAMSAVLVGTGDEHAQRFGGYQNLRELMTQCMRQHVEWHVPDIFADKIKSGAPQPRAIPTKDLLAAQPAGTNPYLFLPVPMGPGQYDGDPLDVPVKMAVQGLQSRSADEAMARAQWAMDPTAGADVPGRAGTPPDAGDVGAVNAHTGPALRAIAQAQLQGWAEHRPDEFAATLRQELAADPQTLRLLEKKGRTWGNEAVQHGLSGNVKRSAHIPPKAEPLPEGTNAVTFQAEVGVLRAVWLRLRTQVGILMNRPGEGKPGRTYHRNGVTGRLIERQRVLIKQFVPSLRPPVPDNKALMADSRVAELAAKTVYQGLPAFLHGFAGTLLDDKAHTLVLPKVRKAVDDEVQRLRDALHDQAMGEFSAGMIAKLAPVLCDAQPAELESVCKAVYDWMKARADNTRAADAAVAAQKADAAWKEAVATRNAQILATVGAHHMERMAAEAAKAKVAAANVASTAEETLRLAGVRLESELHRIMGIRLTEAAANVIRGGGVGLVRGAPGDPGSSGSRDPVVQFLADAAHAFGPKEAAIVEQETALRNRLAMTAVGRATLGEFDRWDRNERQYALKVSKHAAIDRQFGIEAELPTDQAPVYRASGPDEALALGVLHRYSGRFPEGAVANNEEADVDGGMVALRPDGSFGQVCDGQLTWNDAVMPDGRENRNAGHGG